MEGIRNAGHGDGLGVAENPEAVGLGRVRDGQKEVVMT